MKVPNALKIPVVIVATLAAGLFVRSFTYYEGAPYSDVSSWLPSTLAAAAVCAGLIAAHKKGWF